MKGLKRLIEKLEDMMTAAAFAEAGDAETARAILKKDGCKDDPKKRISGRKSIVLRPRHT